MMAIESTLTFWTLKNRKKSITVFMPTFRNPAEKFYF